jgi:nicotinamide-nucleotide amidase
MEIIMKAVSIQVKMLAALLLQRNFSLGTAESCTGGLIGHLLTNEAGSSAWYQGGIVAYSNDLKIKVLGVDNGLLDKHGAVSSECVLSMAKGVQNLTGSQVGLAVSGIAGPGGGTLEKPVGTVYIGWSVLNEAWWEKNLFQGTRTEIKVLTAKRALERLWDNLKLKWFPSGKKDFPDGNGITAL